MSDQEPAFRPVTLTLPDFDPRLRAAVDEDPLVEEMVERLRRGVGGLVAVDRWGRPTSWRDVVRIALGTSLLELRDARTSRALLQAVEERPRADVGAAVEGGGPADGAPVPLQPRPRRATAESLAALELGEPR